MNLALSILVFVRVCNKVVHELAVIGCNLPSDHCNTWDSVPQKIEDVVTSDLVVCT